MWREFHALSPDLDTCIETRWQQILNAPPQTFPDFVEHACPSDFRSVTVSIPNTRGFTLSPFEAFAKIFNGNLMGWRLRNRRLS